MTTVIYTFYKGYQDGLNKIKLRTDGGVCEGIYVDCKTEKGSEGDTLYRYFFEYHIDGVRYEISTMKSKPDKFNHLTNRTILYDKQNPQNAVFQDEI
jgi:hypothetical protein